MTVLVREDLNDHDLLWAAAGQAEAGARAAAAHAAWPLPEPPSATKATTGSPAPGHGVVP